ncbi:hypothetical protein HID58_081035 [Brassica napus]|uniref:Uncharacterized protein n=1 Tax=Brassica napus TaxID=3708 RepID=A0ABQ7Y6L9_BRANA|nr:hypothetical protein HID58_081035 [Brassica napus]
MSVVGLDLGNENCVIAVAKQRGIDVLLNDESNRENPAMVSFGEKQRFTSVQILAMLLSHLKQVAEKRVSKQEKDVRSFIKRDEFEKLSSGLFRVKRLWMTLVLSLDQIHSVELVGSGSRIPAISKMLSSLFKRELGRTVNASECVARGCALQCAMLSPVFRVRDYERKHVGFGSLFTQTMTKCLRIRQSQIGSFTIGPFQISHGEAARVNVRVQLNLHGIVSIDSASLIEDHKENMTSEERNNHQSSATKDDTSSSTVTEQDLKMESTKDKKNALESFVYEMRDKMLNTYRNTATESERECIVRNLQETEEWLYEDGDDESENAYIEKLNDIRKLIDPIENRFKG